VLRLTRQAHALSACSEAREVAALRGYSRRELSE